MWQRIKSNKYVLYGGAIIGLIVVFMLVRNMTGGGGAAQVVTASGPTDAQVAAQTQLALAQIQMQGEQNQANVALAVQTMQIQGDFAKAQLSADLQRYAIDKDSQNQAMQIQAQEASDARAADLQASIAKWTLDNAAAMQASNNAFQLDYAQAANSSALAMAQIQAGVVNTQIQSNEHVTIASLQSQAAQLASYLNAQVAMNDSDNSKDVATAQIQAGVQKHGQKTGLIGGIVGGILGIFSDRRLKRDAVLIGYERDGMPVYAYRYHDSPSFTLGYMADDVAEIRPETLGPVIEGYATVRYERVAMA